MLDSDLGLPSYKEITLTLRNDLVAGEGEFVATQDRYHHVMDFSTLHVGIADLNCALSTIDASRPRDCLSLSIPCSLLRASPASDGTFPASGNRRVMTDMFTYALPGENSVQG